MISRRCTGAILAGGQASRMGGSAKGLLQVGNHRIIDRVAGTLREATESLIVVSNAPDAADWIPGSAVARDERPGLGALSGIHAALRATGTDVIVLAWDAPFVPGALLRALRDAGELADAGMAAPASRSPWGFEPLCCWISAQAIDQVEVLLDANDGRVGALGAHTRLLTVDASSWGDPDDIFFNVNSPTDLDQAAAIAARMTR